MNYLILISFFISLLDYNTKVFSYTFFEHLDIVMIDSPWTSNGPSFVRAAALFYDCLKLTTLKKINLKEFQKKEGIVVIWIVNKSYFQVLKGLKKYGWK